VSGGGRAVATVREAGSGDKVRLEEGNLAFIMAKELLFTAADPGTGLRVSEAHSPPTLS
jgi:hypothetical protein